MTKIVIVTYKDGTINWFPYSLETLDYLAINKYHKDIQIIKCGVNHTQYIITKTV